VERKYEVGASVVYVDPFGVPCPALVTIWWQGIEAYKSEISNEPGCNVVFVSNDEQKTDTYGSQLERATSIVHKTKQPAHGSYWCWPEEI